MLTLMRMLFAGSLLAITACSTTVRSGGAPRTEAAAPHARSPRPVDGKNKAASRLERAADASGVSAAAHAGFVANTGYVT